MIIAPLAPWLIFLALLMLAMIFGWILMYIENKFVRSNARSNARLNAEKDLAINDPKRLALKIFRKNKVAEDVLSVYEFFTGKTIILGNFNLKSDKVAKILEAANIRSPSIKADGSEKGVSEISFHFADRKWIFNIMDYGQQSRYHAPSDHKYGFSEKFHTIIISTYIDGLCLSKITFHRSHGLHGDFKYKMFEPESFENGTKGVKLLNMLREAIDVANDIISKKAAVILEQKRISDERSRFKI